MGEVYGHSETLHSQAPRVVRVRWCRFRFKLDARVAFVGKLDVTGVVLGRMEDSNGRHYEIQYEVPLRVRGVVVGVQSLRRWFSESLLCEAAEKVTV